ncbi:hypothetical protein [Longimicrobium sp.]|uniref:hypothetical protein n=1 Tax=Longimicrobium sp. TaxID=2029185 RepID=UPI002CF6C46C|nr:hypothetical protein [Longimicrobium sp.]HSU17491.1 hypothetical protein [Longimicrobium sp.]
MSPLAWAAAGAVAGLGAALALVRSGLVPAWLLRGGSGADGRGGSSIHGRTANEAGAGDTVCVRLAYDDLKLIRDDIQGLHVIRNDLRHVGDLLERLLEEAMAFQATRLNLSPTEPGGSTRDTLRERVRDTAPAGGFPWQQGGRGRRREEQHDDYDGGFDANLPTRGAATGDPAWSAPAAAQPREPSPDAVFVSASNDAVIPSERHPPEAWLERRGGEGDVWLNPRVALTDPALQRWSTFFDWERREPGARYQADRPAVVAWSGNGGSVLRKGVARPL